MDRIGKCCDFVSNNSKYNQMMLNGREDDEGFIVVETGKVKQKQKKPQAKQQNTITQYMTYNPHYKSRPGKKRNVPNYGRYNNRNYNRTKFVAAGLIHSHWTIVKDVAIPQLDKKKIDYELEDPKTIGSLYKYKKTYEQIRVKKP